MVVVRESGIRKWVEREGKLIEEGWGGLRAGGVGPW